MLILIVCIQPKHKIKPSKESVSQFKKIDFSSITKQTDQELTYADMENQSVQVNDVTKNKLKENIGGSEKVFNRRVQSAAQLFAQKRKEKISRNRTRNRKRTIIIIIVTILAFIALTLLLM
jgi:predicted nucleic acid-binding Zn ribbon protein